MFERTLSQKMKRVFDLDKVTFDRASESQEQECAFIEISTSINTIKDGRAIGKVTGKLRVFANSEKLPYGYFSKKIQEADTTDTKDLFFYDFEENAGTYRNIVERALSFIYLFDAQYDPNLGELSEINLSYAENE